MKITTKLLREKNACEMQVRLFHRLFRNGGKVTLERCLLASENGLSLHWASCNLLTRKQERHFDRKLARTEALVVSKMPYWSSFALTAPAEAEGVDRSEYLAVRDGIRNRAAGRAFFAACQIGE